MLQCMSPEVAYLGGASRLPSGPLSAAKLPRPWPGGAAFDDLRRHSEVVAEKRASVTAITSRRRPPAV
jgi:hypothetical protein